MNMSTSQEVHSGAKIVDSMSRKDFHLIFVRGLGQTKAFSALASFRAENISLEEKREVRMALNNAGIPFALTESDSDLNEIAAAISARAVALR